jgi:hypothetical protein
MKRPILLPLGIYLPSRLPPCTCTVSADAKWVSGNWTGSCRDYRIVFCGASFIHIMQHEQVIPLNQFEPFPCAMGAPSAAPLTFHSEVFFRLGDVMKQCNAVCNTTAKKLYFWNASASKLVLQGGIFALQEGIFRQQCWACLCLPAPRERLFLLIDSLAIVPAVRTGGSCSHGINWVCKQTSTGTQAHWTLVSCQQQDGTQIAEIAPSPHSENGTRHSHQDAYAISTPVFKAVRPPCVVDDVIRVRYRLENW